MAYTLISTEYIPPVGGAKLVQGIKGGRIPRGAIRGSNGSFIVKSEYIPPECNLYFEDSNGNTYCFDAYSTIKNNMKAEKVTENRCIRVGNEVKKIAATSNTYEPEKWVIQAVQKLRI